MRLLNTTSVSALMYFDTVERPLTNKLRVKSPSLKYNRQKIPTFKPFSFSKHDQKPHIFLVVCKIFINIYQTGEKNVKKAVRDSKLNKKSKIGRY